MKVLLRFAVLAVATASFAGPVLAQQYPARPVRMLIGFPPGGGTDIVGRIVAQKLSESLGQSIIVENRGGASGQIAAEIAAKSPPDGYTVMMGHIAAMSILPTLYPKLPYDPVKDFAPITLTCKAPMFMEVNPGVPARTVAEFVALAKAKPGEMSNANSGNGSTGHMAAEVFAQKAAESADRGAGDDEGRNDAVDQPDPVAPRQHGGDDAQPGDSHARQQNFQIVTPGTDIQEIGDGEGDIKHGPHAHRQAGVAHADVADVFPKTAFHLRVFELGE